MSLLDDARKRINAITDEEMVKLCKQRMRRLKMLSVTNRRIR